VFKIFFRPGNFFTYSIPIGKVGASWLAVIAAKTNGTGIDFAVAGRLQPLGPELADRVFNQGLVAFQSRASARWDKHFSRGLFS